MYSRERVLDRLNSSIIAVEFIVNLVANFDRSRITYTTNIYNPDEILRRPLKEEPRRKCNLYILNSPRNSTDPTMCNVPNYVT